MTHARLRAWARAQDTRPAGVLHLHRETVVPAPLDRTFSFFADAANLQQLTPPWLHFTILTKAPVVLRAGAAIQYRIRLYGVPVPWTSIIDVWEPSVRFIDRQVEGPYRWWHHEHRFEPAAGGTAVIDHVQYLPRLPWVSRRLVRRDLVRIFDYREAALGRIFAAPSARSGV